MWKKSLEIYDKGTKYWLDSFVKIRETKCNTQGVIKCSTDKNKKRKSKEIIDNKAQ